MDPRTINRSFVFNLKGIACGAMFALGASLLGCQGDLSPAINDNATATANLLEILDKLRPSQAEIAQMIANSQKRDVNGLATAAGISPASAPYVTAIELHPYLLDSLGNYVRITAETSLSELADGTLAILPYEISYQDDTTSLTGFMDLRFVWNGNENVFGPANPTHIISQAIEAEGAYVRGTVYNKILDLLLDDVSHNNGQLPNPEVLAIANDGVVYTGTSSSDGTFEIGPLPVGKTYTIGAGGDGFQSALAHVFISEVVLIEGFDLDVMAIISDLQQTGIVFGRVIDLDGDPVANAAVRLVDGASQTPVESVLGHLANDAGEYALVNINLPSSVTYQTQGMYFAADGYSSAFTIDSLAGQLVQRDIVIDNHKPTIVCQADAASGSAIAITVETSSETLLTATANDSDDDVITITWADPQDGQIYSQLGGGVNVKTVTFAAPDYATTFALTATVNDWVSTRSCSVLIDVVYPSN